MEMVGFTEEPAMMNEQYWRDYYATPHTLEPSPFARWAGEQLRGKKILDLGCGNGRDTNYLRCENDVIGVDLFAPAGEWFRRQSIESFLATDPDADVAYCRFLFQAIDGYLQSAIINWAWRKQVALYIEARSSFDRPKIINHDRRLINGKALLHELLFKGFYVTYYREGRGMAPFGGEDPCIVRIVAQPNAQTLMAAPEGEEK
jgi:SAM-dependent methyltransferase